MKTTAARSLRSLPPLLLIWGCSSVALLAQTDQTITGNLFVIGNSDFGGNSLSFGSRTADPLLPGAIWNYADGTTPQITWSASQPGFTWLWQASTGPQLRVDGTNTLGLFVPGATTPAIILNPAGLSTFTEGLTATGVTGGANGLTLNAGGTGNQNITLVPTGAGVTTTTAPVRVTNGTSSSSTSTGALTVTGGVGVGGTLNAGNVTTGGTVNAGTLRLTNVATSLTNLGLGMANTANFGAINAADPSFFYPAPVARVSHTATTGPFLQSPQVVTVSGNFAFVGSNSSTSFQIIDITNPLAPVKRGALVGNGSAGAAKLSYPRGIAISGDFAYVTSSTNNSLQVIDITNPDSPAAAGSLINGAGAALSAPYGITISGNFAYIASSGSKALEIVNISAPATPVHEGQLTNNTWLNGARAVAVAVSASGTYAYVVSNTGNCLAVIDVTNPAAPTLAATLAHNAAGPLLAGPTAIALSGDGNYAYVTSATSNALQIIDIRNPLVPVARGALVNGTAGAQLLSPSALTVVGNTAFVTSNGTTKAVQIVDVSNPLAPTPKGQLLDTIGGASLNGPTGIAVSGNYAYVAASSNNALQILSITSGGGFQVKGSTVLTTNSANDVLLGSGLPAAKVAIGTTNATARLTVAGSDTAATSSAANFTDSAGKSLLLVRNDGKVGIGTATPELALHIKDVWAGIRLESTVPGYANSGTLYAGGGGLFFRNDAAGTNPFAVSMSAPSSSLEVASNGNVGIGINTPTAKLDVSGDAKISGTLTVGGQSVVTANQLSSYAKPTALYNNSGSAIASVGSDGKVNFASGLTVGTEVIASGDASTAMGYLTTAIGLYSTATGYETTARGGASTAMGSSTVANGYSSTAMGFGTSAVGFNSTAMGSETGAIGGNSTVMGNFTHANAFSSLVIGQYNMVRPENSAHAWVATDDLFVIGNGIEYIYDEAGNYIYDEAGYMVSGRSNAFSVKKNGETYIQGNLGIGTPAPTAKLEVAGDAKISGTTTLTGAVIAQNNITVRNRKVIRVNAAGDIPMIGYTQPGDEPEVLP